MAFVRAGGLVVHYDLTGPEGAPVIMFSNSLGTNFHVWDPQAAALAGRFRVLRYDMRGHGLTDCPPAGDGGYTIDGLAQDAIALLDALSVDRVHFCGLSIGGMVGQRFAAAAPERVISLALCDTASRIGPASRWDDRIVAVSKGGIEAVAEAVLKVWFTQDFLSNQPEAARGYANMLIRTPVPGYIGCCIAVRDADLHADDVSIKCPTLVVVGDQDQSTPPAAARELVQAIHGARLEIIAGAAHIPTAEQPAALNRLLSEFFSAHAAAFESVPKRRRV